jgi:hypothetical protein
MTNVRAEQAAAEFNRFAEGMGMPAKCDAALDFENRKLADAAAIWREKSSQSALPPRSEFCARTLKSYLPNVIVADAVEESGRCRFWFRLMGTTISELLGDHTGKFLDDAIVSPFRERWSAVLDSANKAGCPMRIHGRLEYQQQNYLSMELMVAPLGPDTGRAPAVLAIAYANYSARHVFEPLVRNRISTLMSVF